MQNKEADVIMNGSRIPVIRDGRKIVEFAISVTCRWFECLLVFSKARERGLWVIMVRCCSGQTRIELSTEPVERCAILNTGILLYLSILVIHTDAVLQ